MVVVGRLWFSFAAFLVSSHFESIFHLSTILFAPSTTLGDCWLNDLWKYDIETQHWTCIQESSGPSSSATAAALPTATSDGNLQNKNDELTVLNTTNGINAQPVVQGKVPTRRFGYVSVVHDGKFVLFGGFDVRVNAVPVF